MTILPQLQRDLRDAARQRSSPSPEAGRGRGPLRRAGTWLPVLGVVLIAIVVGGLALGLGRAPHRTQPAGRHLRNRSTPAVRGEEVDYSLAADPSRAQLLANFGVLRRAQDARDRSWHPDCDCGRAARQLTGLTRYARTLPGHLRAFFDVEQLTFAGQYNLPADSYVLSLDLVGPHGDVDSEPFGPETGYFVEPLAAGRQRRGLRRPQTREWAGVVPDGVARVRWTFACADGPRERCPAPRPHVDTVAVIHNVAAERVAHSCQFGPRCASVVRVQWLTAGGAVIETFGRAGGNLPAAPFVTGGRGPRSLDVLGTDAIGSARLGRSAIPAITALDALLGPAAQRNVPVHSCGIDHESVWASPAAGEPLTIYQRDGRFVGYQYGAPASEIGLQPGPGATLRTSRGLTVGDTIGRLRDRYRGHAVRLHAAHGAGSWRVSTGAGTLDGAVLPITYPLRSITARNRIVTIQAGDTGCPPRS